MNRGTTVALALVLAPFARATAEDPKSAASKIDVLVRGLESNDATVHAKAATELGESFPEGARAVPVLLDAIDDDDVAVRSASVRALRRLGRAGLEEAVRRLSRPEDGVRSMFVELGATLNALGPNVFAWDIAHAQIWAATESARAIEGTMWLVAGMNGDLSPKSTDADVLTITLPWLESKDARIASAASAAVAILGRAQVASRAATTPGVTDEESPSGLAPLLSHPYASVQWASWRIVGRAAPHGRELTSAILDRWQSQEHPIRPRPESGESPLDWLHVDAFEPCLLSIGSRASGVARPLVKRGHVLSSPHVAELLWRLGERDAALDRWRNVLETAKPRASEELVDVAQRVPEFLAEAAPRLAGWIVRALEEDRAFRELAADPALAAPDEEATPAEEEVELPGATNDPVSSPSAREAGPPSIEHTRESCLDLCCLAIQSRGAAVDDRTRALAVRAVTRALLELPEGELFRSLLRRILRMGDGAAPLREAFADALANRAQPDPLVNVVIRALANVGEVPSRVTRELSRALARPPDEVVSDPDFEWRLRHHAGWPHLRVAVLVSELGEVALAPGGTRLAAIEALARIEKDGRDAARTTLKPFANDADARVRYRVARALRRLGA